MIPFNKAPYFEKVKEYVLLAMEQKDQSTAFCQLCAQWLTRRFLGTRAFMTNSCSAALDMAAMLLDLKPGDEVIMPSFTFSSTANAFVKQGAIPVFVDIRLDTMNLNEKKIEAAITQKTKAIVAMHYAGIACEMNAIMELAGMYHLAVVEDAAQAVLGSYYGKYLGTIGDLGCISFHETKNFSMGEGGALLMGRDSLYDRAEIIGDCGTSRGSFRRGELREYTWMEAGASCFPGELGCACLYAQLEQADSITGNRVESWQLYYDGLKPFEEKGWLRLPAVPDGCRHNGHIFYIRLKDKPSRDQLLTYLLSQGITGAFHYIPLHTSPAGRRYGRFHGEDIHTTEESGKLLRLPLYYNISHEDIERIVEVIDTWFQNSDGRAVV